VVAVLLEVRGSNPCSETVPADQVKLTSLCSRHEGYGGGGGVALELYPLFTSARDGGEWSSSRAANLPPCKKTGSTE
jgi:hypothetical protein